MNFRALSLVALLFFSTRAQTADWPQWRGPHRSGFAHETNFPDQLPSQPKVIWKKNVGEGFASPLVAGDSLVYLDNQAGKETVHCLSRQDGVEKWSETVDDVFKDSQGPPGPRCTPLIDGKNVYVQSSKGEFQCRALLDGKLIWRTSFTNDFGSLFIGEKGQAQGATRHGYNGSPAVAGDHLFVTVGSTNDASLVCFDKINGKVIWKSQRDLAAYAAPFVTEISGTKQVLYFTSEGLIGLRVTDGKLLWRVPMKTDYARHVMTPVVFENIVVAGSHQVGLVGTILSRQGGQWSAARAWVSKEAAVNFSSPVALNGILYGLGPTKNIFALDLKTGRTLWSKEGYFNFSAEKAHAGFIVLGNKLLILTDGGELILLRADSKECVELGRRQICSMTWSDPAYADGVLYLRDGVKGTGDLMAVQLR